MAFYYADIVIRIITIMRAGEKIVEDIEISVKIRVTGLFLSLWRCKRTVVLILRDRIEEPL